MRINWDEYYSKHCARYYGWLPACIEFKRKKKGSLKYFTLCGEKAIDVFMLEMEKVLQRDKNGMLSGVIICERDEGQVPEILRLIRPPEGRDAVIPAALERVLTFEDDEDTRNKAFEDYDSEEPPSRRLRDKLRIKGLALRLKGFFPFDVINFDPCNNLLRSPDDALYLSFKKIFEFQGSANSFLLFLTTPISDIHRGFQSRFKNDLETNVSKNARIRETLQSETGTTKHEEIDENKRIAISIAKSIVLSAAREYRWNSIHRGIYIYENKKRRKMLSSVVEFAKAGSSSDQTKYYIEDIIRVIKQMPNVYSYEDSLRNREVVEDLDGIKEYRDNFSLRNEYRL